MLRFSEVQIVSLRGAARAAFAARLASHLRARAPGFGAALDDAALRLEAEAMVARASKVGFTTRERARRYCLAEAAARGAAGRPPPAWLIQAAGAARPSPSLRLAAIEEMLPHALRAQTAAKPEADWA